MNKNDKPAVNEVRGPNGTDTRSQSEDGKFTSSDLFNQEDEEVEAFEPLAADKAQFNYKSGYDTDNAYLNNTYFEPAFKMVLGKIFNNEIFEVRKANKRRDEVYGIDFEVFEHPIKGKGFVTFSGSHYYSIDAKTQTSSLGDPEFYENPTISINLFKTFKSDDNGEQPVDKSKDVFPTARLRIMSGDFHPGTFANGKHQNNFYGYSFLKSPHTQDELLEGSPLDLEEAKLYLIPRKVLHEYVTDNYLKNNTVRDLIGYFTRNRNTNKYIVTKNLIDLAEYGGMKVKLDRNGHMINVQMDDKGSILQFQSFIEDGKKVMSVRMYMPISIFDEDPKLVKKKIKKIIKFRKENT